MSKGDKNIIRYLICLWIGFSSLFYIQYFFQEPAIKENSLVIKLSDLNILQEFNYSSNLFEARCIYKNSLFDKDAFVCPVNELTESIQFQIREAVFFNARKTVLDYCTKRRAIISHLQKLREYVITKDILSDTVDIFYFRDSAFLLYDYIDEIKKVSKIHEYVTIEPCQE